MGAPLHTFTILHYPEQVNSTAPNYKEELL